MSVGTLVKDLQTSIRQVAFATANTSFQSYAIIVFIYMLFLHNTEADNGRIWNFLKALTTEEIPTTNN